MTYNEARGRIETHLLAAWETVYPTNVIDFENVMSVSIESLAGKMYANTEIDFSSANQSAMAGSASPYRVEGIFYFNIFTSAGKGSKEALEVFDFMSTLFNLTVVSGIVFRTAREIDSATEVDLYRLSCSINFTFDSFTP